MKKIITLFLISLFGFAQNKENNDFKFQISVILCCSPKIRQDFHII